MEIQLTDFENAAFTVVITLLVRAFIHFDLSKSADLLLPIQRCDENFRRAMLRDAVLEQRLYWRLFQRSDEFSELTVGQLFNGCPEFEGFLPLIRRYLDAIQCPPGELQQLERYLRFVGYRASGQLQTLARWSRDYISKHPDYQKDSIITDKVQYDWIQTLLKISTGETPCPELFGDYSPIC